MEMIIEPSMTLLKVGVGCLPDCCVIDCPFCEQDWDGCRDCDCVCDDGCIIDW